MSAYQKKAKKGYDKDKEQIILDHMALVKRIAHHLIARLPPVVMVDDLYQAGLIGLMEAVDKFDETKGASFETYAGIRIKGAMLDEVRKGDWAPRSIHRNSRMISEAIRAIEGPKGGAAMPQEIAAFLQISVEQYFKMANEISYVKVFGLDDLGITVDVIDDVHMSSSSQPVDKVLYNEFKDALKEAVKSLPEKEALVLALYYEEDLNLREIGAVLGVTESRVSQIHSQAVVRLKTKMGEWG